MRKVFLFLPVIAAFNSILADDKPAPVSLKQIDRTIVEEPEYASLAPLYGLYVLDVENQTRAWAVLDKSKANGPGYDVLYFDKNGNGRLTDDGERFENESGNFQMGDFIDPNTGDTHTDLKLRYSSTGSVMFGLNWKGKHRVGGGYSNKPGPYTMFGKSPGEAPIIKNVGEGAFAFQTWMAPETLKIGDNGNQNDIKFFVGHAGVGPNTFSSVMHPFLPEDVALEATLVYETAAGEEAEVTTKLKDRC